MRAFVERRLILRMTKARKGKRKPSKLIATTETTMSTDDNYHFQWSLIRANAKDAGAKREPTEDDLMALDNIELACRKLRRLYHKPSTVQLPFVNNVAVSIAWVSKTDEGSIAHGIGADIEGAVVREFGGWLDKHHAAIVMSARSEPVEEN